MCMLKGEILCACLCVCVLLTEPLLFSLDASTYAHYLFNAFDSGNNGSIKFEVILSVSLCVYLTLFFLLCFLLLFFSPLPPLSYSIFHMCDSHLFSPNIL